MSFDWEDVARRLAASGAALAAQGTDDPAAQERLLRERAAALAAPGQAHQVRGGIEALAFRCAGERYAFEASFVVRASPMLPLTRIPGTPAFIAGVTMVEGEVLAVLDLRVLLALPLAELCEPDALVVLEGEGRGFAVLADAIDGMRRFAPQDMGHCLPALADLDQSYLLGVAADRTALLDARRLLTDSTLVVNADH